MLNVGFLVGVFLDQRLQPASGVRSRLYVLVLERKPHVLHQPLFVRDVGQECLHGGIAVVCADRLGVRTHFDETLKGDLDNRIEAGAKGARQLLYALATISRDCSP